MNKSGLIRNYSLYMERDIVDIAVIRIRRLT